MGHQTGVSDRAVGGVFTLDDTQYGTNGQIASEVCVAGAGYGLAVGRSENNIVNHLNIKIDIGEQHVVVAAQ